MCRCVCVDWGIHACINIYIHIHTHTGFWGRTTTSVCTRSQVCPQAGECIHRHVHAHIHKYMACVQDHKSALKQVGTYTIHGHYRQMHRCIRMHRYILCLPRRWAHIRHIHAHTCLHVLHAHTYTIACQHCFPWSIFLYIYIHTHTYIHTLVSSIVKWKHHEWIHTYIHTYIHTGISNGRRCWRVCITKWQGQNAARVALCAKIPGMHTYVRTMMKIKCNSRCSVC